MKNQIQTLVCLAVCAATIFTTNKANALIVNTSVTDGTWGTGSNWSTNGSTGLTKFVIDEGDTVTLNVNVTNVDTLWIKGGLSFNANRTITINSGGVIILDWTGVIYGGSSNSGFIFAAASGYPIQGPFTAANGKLLNNGPRYASAASTTAALGDPQGSFIGLSLLPVQLSSINVEKVGAAFELTWTALGESNQNNFTVEVSTDGRNFSFAGMVNGNRELVEGSYNFPINGIKNSFYIRLSETDLNGTKTVLATKYVKNNTTTVDAFQVYPTLIAPAGQTINMVLPISGNYNVVVYSMDMQVAAESTATTYSENEAVAFNSSDWNLNVGHYVVVVTGNNGEVHKTRIMVR